jgi:hypothetical protein
MSDKIDWITARPLKRGEVWVRRDGDETAVYDPDSGQLSRLNPSALALWELCDGETTAEEMAEAISELTGSGAESVFEQVTETLRNFLGQGLIYFK